MELKELYALMEKFEKSGLSELVYKQDGEEVCLKKAIAAAVAQAPMAVPVAVTHAPHETRSAEGAARTGLRYGAHHARRWSARSTGPLLRMRPLSWRRGTR